MASSPSKNHVRYEAELRLRAKDQRLGLVTVHVRFPDGTEREYQTTATPEECRFAAWAGALVSDEGIRAVPDLQQLARLAQPETRNTE